MPSAEEHARIVDWRLLELLKAGYPQELAERLAPLYFGAGFVDLHAACELVRRGCAPDVAVSILL